jgi:8-oxo-dGTP diphosphatase
MKKIRDVTAAIILNDNKVFIARRAPGEKMAGGWEFPGGKPEANETAEECLRRELFEELGVEARIKDLFCESTYEYPQGTIRLLAYFAEIVHGDISLSVHDDYIWADVDELPGYDLLPADIPVAEKLIKMMSSK